jgi:hypothetical protein
MAARPSTPIETAAPAPEPVALSVRWGLLRGGGTKGNERLTGLAGALLIVLLAVIGVTIIDLRGLLWLHLFVGMLLIGPLALKLASTLYRFTRYYTRDAAYRAVGPPITVLRVLGPVVVLTTLVVFVTGVVLLFAGPSSRAAVLPIHKISFIVWIAFTGVHVLAHLPALGAALRGDYAPGGTLPGPRLAGRDGRSLALAGALVAGLVLAVLVLGEFGSWTHWNATFHHHGH